MKNYKTLLFFLLVVALWSCEDIIEVPDISDRSVKILAPSDNSELDTLNIKFNWETIEDANTYRVQIADPNFIQAEQILVDSLIDVVDSLGTGNSFNHQFTDYGNYEWRIKAINSAYETPFTKASFQIGPQ